MRNSPVGVLLRIPEKQIPAPFSLFSFSEWVSLSYMLKNGSEKQTSISHQKTLRFSD